jgi:hypothetical protein
LAKGFIIVREKIFFLVLLLVGLLLIGHQKGQICFQDFNMNTVVQQCFNRNKFKIVFFVLERKNTIIIITYYFLMVLVCLQKKLVLTNLSHKVVEIFKVHCYQKNLPFRANDQGGIRMGFKFKLKCFWSQGFKANM